MFRFYHEFFAKVRGRYFLPPRVLCPPAEYFIKQQGFIIFLICRPCNLLKWIWCNHSHIHLPTQNRGDCVKIAQASVSLLSRIFLRGTSALFLTVSNDTSTRARFHGRKVCRSIFSSPQDYGGLSCRSPRIAIHG